MIPSGAIPIDLSSSNEVLFLNLGSKGHLKASIDKVKWKAECHSDESKEQSALPLIQSFRLNAAFCALINEGCHIEALKHEDKVTFLIDRTISYTVDLTSFERSFIEQIAMLDHPLKSEVLVDPKTKKFKCMTYDETCKQVVDVTGTV